MSTDANANASTAEPPVDRIDTIDLLIHHHTFGSAAAAVETIRAQRGTMASIRRDTSPRVRRLLAAARVA